MLDKFKCQKQNRQNNKKQTANREWKMANGSANGQRVKFEIVEICLVRKLYPAPLGPIPSFSTVCYAWMMLLGLKTDPDPDPSHCVRLRRFGNSALCTLYAVFCALWCGQRTRLEEHASGQRSRLRLTEAG